MARSKSPTALSLPARYYTDQEYYRAELEWLFLSKWFHAGRAEDIAKPGQFVRARNRGREPDHREG